MQWWARENSLCGLGHFDDGQWVGGPERFGRDGLPSGPSLEGGTVMMTTAVAVATATTAVHQQVVRRHLHGHYVLGEWPDYLSELVYLVAQMLDTGVALIQPVLQPGDIIVLFPGLGQPAGQLALQVPQPVHHGGAHRCCTQECRVIYNGGVYNIIFIYGAMAWYGQSDRFHAVNAKTKTATRTGCGACSAAGTHARGEQQRRRWRRFTVAFFSMFHAPQPGQGCK